MSGRGNKAVLALGDAVIFVVFAWTGRSSHHEATAAAVPAVLGTAGPFLAAWFVVAALLGVYRPSGQPSQRGDLRRAALAWVVACPLGLVLRALVLRRGIPPTFAGITFAFNLALLLAWRGLLALVEARRSPERRTSGSR